MIRNYGDSVEKIYNPIWPYKPDHSFRILIIGVSGSGKTHVLLNLIKYQRKGIDKIYFYVKDSY